MDAVKWRLVRDAKAGDLLVQIQLVHVCIEECYNIPLAEYWLYKIITSNEMSSDLWKKARDTACYFKRYSRLGCFGEIRLHGCIIVMCTLICDSPAPGHALKLYEELQTDTSKWEDAEYKAILGMSKTPDQIKLVMEKMKSDKEKYARFSDEAEKTKKKCPCLWVRPGESTRCEENTGIMCTLNATFRPHCITVSSPLSSLIKNLLLRVKKTYIWRMHKE